MDQRFQSASDVAFALEALSTSSAATASAPAIAAYARPGRRRLVLGAFAVALIGAAAFLAGRFSRPPVRDVTFTPLTYRQ